ncbi:phage major capsid protein [Snodgrassella sp. CFCC 13594]|uniref:phage major capsid protein n=1 Tax=Snodgrassella sp. CFCC 13594 TaxID=1775559 RepID=UPI00082D47D8|nr:phage major capsid protein [Snodgrassella sp. CFCC 13594]
MEIAQSTLTIKSVTDEGVIVGIASTPKLDKSGDVVEPMGAEFELPIPLLHEHDQSQPIGMVEKATVTENGIEVTARIAKDASGRVKAVWENIKNGIVGGLSVGFLPIEKSDMETGRHFTRWQWLELSVVGNPANPEAAITVTKSLNKPEKGNKSMSIQEQIQEQEAKKAKLVEANGTLVCKSDVGEADQAAYDANKAEIEKIDKHLSMLRETEAQLAKTAKPVTMDTTGTVPTGQIEVKSNLPKGTAFARYARALAMSKGNTMQAVEIAKSFKDTPQVERILKSAVAAGTTTDATWAAPLVDYTTMTSEFIELLRPQTIMGRITGFRNVPFNTKVQGQTSGATVNWVGQGKLKPVSKLALDTTSLGFAKVSAIVPITEELARLSNPSAEALINSDLQKSMAQFLDQAFIDPTIAAVTDVHPASITHAVTAITPSGTDLDAVRKDIKAVMNQFINANLSTKGGVWVMSEVTALSLSMMFNELGQPAFPSINQDGGTFFGLPVITSSIASDNIILLQPSEILLADDGMVTLDASREASLVMSDDPESDKATMDMVSLWQAGMVGFKADRMINWKVRRAASVAVIESAAYGE